MIQQYNKLVRDNIVEIIKKNGAINVTYKVLDDKEYEKELNKKLKEEVNEYLSDLNMEEMADVMEVIYAILDFKGVTMSEVEEIRKVKKQKRGGFSKRIFLEEVEE